jgi:hypothetical protein
VRAAGGGGASGHAADVHDRSRGAAAQRIDIAIGNIPAQFYPVLKAERKRGHTLMRDLKMSV